MENHKILVYALSGAWSTPDTDGSVVIGIALEIEPLQEKLQKIIDSDASEYFSHPAEIANMEIGERHFEMVDVDGNYAKFYITEHYLELSAEMMRMISSVMKRRNLEKDVESYLKGLLEGENIESWKYEYMMGNVKLVQKAVGLYEKYEDCNTSFNATLELAVNETTDAVTLNDQIVKILWERFGDIPVNDDGEILDSFMGYEPGTQREEIWLWFDDNYSKGVASLMYE